MNPLELGLFLVAGLFLFGSLDDFFLDIVHTVFNLKPKKVSKIDLESWKKLDEKPIAVMIPAWQEYDVLEAMVKTNLKRIQYENYHWFIGVYPNDEKTLTIALDLEKRYKDKITVVVNNMEGPTSKAQCLNRVLEVMMGGIDKAIKEGTTPWIPHYIAIHDAEDVIHPLSFKAINAQDIDLDFIQVPIFSLPVSTKEWVAGTYLDEFSDIHLREIPVRQKLKMPIPSAGVGTFFSFEILNKMGVRFGHYFDEGNLTEDYEVSMKIARLGGKQLFMLLEDPNGDIIATREFFPASFGRSVRQKTRWTTGIGLQTMMKWGEYAPIHKLPTYKNIMARYGLYRDRKALWANPLVFLAWGILIFGGVTTLIDFSIPVDFKYEKALTYLMAANLTLFALRIVQRMRFTATLYGALHGIFTIPRLFLGSVINAFAAIRAISQFSSAKKENKVSKIEWDKTQHFFPEEYEIDQNIEVLQ